MQILRSFLLATILILLSTALVYAHQPYFEDTDTTRETPQRVIDSDVSTALYSTLESATDEDWFIMRGQKGQNLFIGMTIPQVEGHIDFDPTIALYAVDGETPIATLDPTEGTVFLEPFSNTAYWQRQRQRFELPESGDYLVKVWHPDGEVGRYVLVVGEREVRGGDPQFRTKLKSYWTPVIVTEAVEAAPPVTEKLAADRQSFRCRLMRFVFQDEAADRGC